MESASCAVTPVRTEYSTRVTYVPIPNPPFLLKSSKSEQHKHSFCFLHSALPSLIHSNFRLATQRATHSSQASRLCRLFLSHAIFPLHLLIISTIFALPRESHFACTTADIHEKCQLSTMLQLLVSAVTAQVRPARYYKISHIVPHVDDFIHNYSLAITTTSMCPY